MTRKAIPDNVVKDALALAKTEIETYGLPTITHFNLQYSKALEISRALGADESIVAVGSCLMDIKLGQAFKEGRLAQHVAMGIETSESFLAKYDIPEKVRSDLINCVAAHHGSVPFSCIESEIVTNADCYKFIHSAGVIHYIGTLSKRHPDIADVLKNAEAKLEEKAALLTLPFCKNELDGQLQAIRAVLAAGKSANTKAPLA